MPLDASDAKPEHPRIIALNIDRELQAHKALSLLYRGAAPPLAVIRALHILGVCEVADGDIAAARAHLHELLRTARAALARAALPDPAIAGAAVVGVLLLSTIEHQLGQPSAAIDAEAIALAEAACGAPAADDVYRVLLAQALVTSANTKIHSAPEAARALFLRALEITEALRSSDIAPHFARAITDVTRVTTDVGLAALDRRSGDFNAARARLKRGVERTRRTLDQSPAGAPARARTALRQHLALLLMELSRTEQIAGYTSAAERRQESLAIIKSLLPDLAPHERPRWRASILTSDRRHRRPPAADS